MRNIFYVVAGFILLMMTGCKEKQQKEEEVSMMQMVEVEIKGDSMLYGLACDGTSDSVIVIWPFDGDPKTYSCINAHDNHRIIGKPTIGDWVGIMINPNDTTEATMVIDLDQLKATWTYPVKPVMKDLKKMSARMQKRMMDDMPDSIKETYLVPREYGFTLKRSHMAQPVGMIHSDNTLESDSPVEYPEVKRYVRWYMLNGRLVLASVKIDPDKAPDPKTPPTVILDTLDFVYMDYDSLIMTLHGQRYGFHRKTNALEANKAAQDAQQKIDSLKKQQEQNR